VWSRDPAADVERFYGHLPSTESPSTKATEPTRFLKRGTNLAREDKTVRTAQRRLRDTNEAYPRLFLSLHEKHRYRPSEDLRQNSTRAAATDAKAGRGRRYDESIGDKRAQTRCCVLRTESRFPRGATILPAGVHGDDPSAPSSHGGIFLVGWSGHAIGAKYNKDTVSCVTTVLSPESSVNSRPPTSRA
jgi:hypothetical protein